MYAFYFARASQILATFFRPKLSATIMDSLAFLISPTLSMETDLFLHLCSNGVTSSPNPSKAEGRFKINTVNVLKRNISPEHEFVFLEVHDADDVEDRGFILERTVNSLDLQARDDVENNGIIEDFFNHEDSMRVLHLVFRSLISVPAAIVATGVAVVAGPVGLSVPAIGSAIIPLAATTLLSPSTEAYPQIVFDRSSNSIADNVTLSLSEAFHFFSDLSSSRRLSKSLSKPDKDAPADDRWLAGVNIKRDEYATAQVARSFKPKNLNLLHMSILAHVVHSEYPLYSLFQNNCYWFANLTYICARAIDSTIIASLDSDFPEQEDCGNLIEMFFLPFHMFIPSVAGRWMGFKVSEVQNIVVRRIVRLFFNQLRVHEENVVRLMAGRSELKESQNELKTKEGELKRLTRRCEQLERMERLDQLGASGQFVSSGLSNSESVSHTQPLFFSAV